MSVVIPKRVPDARHPFPDLRAAFGQGGWSFFRTRDARDGITAHAVFCASLPVPCVKAHGFTEHLWGPPDEMRARMPIAALVLQHHSRACPPCAHALSTASRHSVQQ
ncbi:hypothetical protein CLV63_1163 [Murinocardiopsis flavida]|uniref:Uncharacterized protein n=1 Tax=Murinocardiopsis flavida TaxID=645275 RepID=A0A2P8D8N0_9ACTN|nr:hypothetical protein [Murinocardiopsis flavida]PSK93596.1 hypothetical protein CLV63_1163 [Murinocardiopsis flavida]